MDKLIDEVRTGVTEGLGVEPEDVEVEPVGMKLGDGIPGVSDIEKREDRLVRIEQKLDRLLELLEE